MKRHLAILAAVAATLTATPTGAQEPPTLEATLIWAGTHADFAKCVRRHESDRGGTGLYMGGARAQNPSSTASGHYQFLDSTWRNVAPKVGAGQYARAKDAPWWVQDDAALWMINNGWRSAWNGTGC